MQFSKSPIQLLYATALILLIACNDQSKKGNDPGNNDAGLVKAMPGKSGIGAKYRSRDPMECADYKEPADGFPSYEQAREYFICQNENVFANKLYLVSDVQFEMGKMRPYDRENDAMNVPNIDVSVPVIPIQGSYKTYQIWEPSEYMQDIGKNCNIDLIQNATGLIYKNSFGEWHVNMGSADSKSIAKGVAPPQ